jgi:pyruvate/2-oxoglutarate/acetoin dehydrogenase E1 component
VVHPVAQVFTLPYAVPCAAVVLLQVMRLSSQDVPTAYAYELEAATIVQPEQVVAAVEQMCGAKVPVAV